MSRLIYHFLLYILDEEDPTSFQGQQLNSAIVHEPVRISTDKEGKFTYGDRVKKIISVKRQDEETILFLVKWKRRSNGIKPADGILTNKELKRNEPELLFNFYEQRILLLPKIN